MMIFIATGQMKIATITFEAPNKSPDVPANWHLIRASETLATFHGYDEPGSLTDVLRVSGDAARLPTGTELTVYGL